MILKPVINGSVLEVLTNSVFVIEGIVVCVISSPASIGRFQVPINISVSFHRQERL